MADHDERSLGSDNLSDHDTPQRSSAENSSAWTEKFESSKAQKVDDAEEDLGHLNYLWILISCGYMVSWTSIGACNLSHNLIRRVALGVLPPLFRDA
jgi:hypothetical protein